MKTPKLIVHMDIEALGTTRTSAMTQIAMIARYADDPEASPPAPDFHMFLPLDPQFEALTPARTVTASTIIWWMAQSEEARALFTQSDSTDFQELVAVMRSFNARFKRMVEDVAEDEYEIWTRGNYDLPIIESVLKQLGLDIPWHFRAARDLRTLMQVAGVNITAVPAPAGFIKHNPLWDCKFQDACYHEAMRTLRSRS